MGLLLKFLAVAVKSLKKLDFLLALSQRICSPERNCPSRHFLDPAAKSAFATSFFLFCAAQAAGRIPLLIQREQVLPLRNAFALVVLAPRSRVRSPA
jgi:hypothetical protein